MTTFIPALHVGRGTRRGPLTVFPVWHATEAGRRVRLADAHVLDVGELADAQVPHLQVSVRGDDPVLLLDGDVLVGGRQDRVTIGSHLLAPGDTGIVDVRCVEPERWHGPDRQIAGTRRATSFVRGSHDQFEIWRRVGLERTRAARPPEVGDLAPLPGQSGVLIGIGGRPTLLEVFATPDLLHQAWVRVLDAAARDCVGRSDRATSAHSARHFIGLVEHLHPLPIPGGGSGRAFGDVHGSVRMRGIADGHRLLHATIVDSWKDAA